MTSTDFAKGDRVIVTDLRTGTLHPGVITKPAAAAALEFVGLNYVTVRYDTGQHVRVGKSFVKREEHGELLNDWREICRTVIEYGRTEKRCSLPIDHEGPHVWGEEKAKHGL